LPSLVSATDDVANTTAGDGSALPFASLFDSGTGVVILLFMASLLFAAMAAFRIGGGRR